MNLAEYMTAPEVGAALRCPPRAVARAAKRAEAEGHVVRATVLGKRVYLRAALPTLTNYYYPYYSEAHQRAVKGWGQKGGKTKAANARRRQSGASGRRDARA